MKTKIYIKKVFMPTVGFALNLDIPESEFHAAERVIADLVLSSDQLNIAAEVPKKEEEEKA